MRPELEDPLLASWQREVAAGKLQLPRLFLAGAAKSGTTSLAVTLDGHPKISLGRKKEPNFFTQDFLNGRKRLLGGGNPWNIRLSASEYGALYDFGKGGGACGLDCSPGYFEFGTRAARRIDGLVGDAARVAVILRNPIDRAYSGFLHLKRDIPDFPAFEQCLLNEERMGTAHDDDTTSLIKAGRYSSALHDFRQVFRGRFRVFIFEEMMADPPATIRALLEFFELETDCKLPSLVHLNVGGEPVNRFIVEQVIRPQPWKRGLKHLLPKQFRMHFKYAVARRLMRRPQMNPATRSRLVEVFRDDVRATESFMGRPLPWRDFKD